jgi:hypothetical protein
MSASCVIGRFILLGWAEGISPRPHLNGVGELRRQPAPRVPCATLGRATTRVPLETEFAEAQHEPQRTVPSAWPPPHACNAKTTYGGVPNAAIVPCDYCPFNRCDAIALLGRAIKCQILLSGGRPGRRSECCRNAHGSGDTDASQPRSSRQRGVQWLVWLHREVAVVGMPPVPTCREARSAIQRRRHICRTPRRVLAGSDKGRAQLGRSEAWHR